MSLPNSFQQNPNNWATLVCQLRDTVAYQIVSKLYLSEMTIPSPPKVK